MRRFLLLGAALLVPCSVAGAADLKLVSFSTLFGEIVTFVILLWVVKKFVVPPIMNAIETRQKEIADGLAAAEAGKQSLVSAEVEKNTMLSEARARGGEMVADSEKRGGEIVEAARREAESERVRIVEAGRREVEAERVAMQRDLREKVGALIVAGAEQVLRREVDAKAHQDIVDAMKKEVV